MGETKVREGDYLENLKPLFARYDRIFVFDTETTGLRMDKDEIIQLSGVLLTCGSRGVEVAENFNTLIALAPGQSVPPEITRLTGITDEALRTQGISRAEACRQVGRLIAGNTLLVAYNAHFDLSFLFHMLFRNGDPSVLKGKDKLDMLTVYRDRHSYPHKLSAAIEVYGLSDQVKNSHSADEDALATVYVMDAAAKERDDLLNYVNLFGYIPKYGPPKPLIRSVTYLPQYYDPKQPLYAGLNGK